MRTLLKYLLLSIGTIIVGMLAIAAAFVTTFEPNDYRELLADRLSQALDREVRIAGNLELAPALVPTLAVNDVTIANPPWATRPTMASVGRLEGTIALLPLLEGRIEIGKILLERVDALLERNVEQRGNWEFPFLMDAGAAEPTSPRYRTQVGAIELRAIDVRYVDADGSDFATHVERITLRRLPGHAHLIEGSGRIGVLPVRIEWRAGPFDARGADPELRWPVAGTLALGASTVTIEGRLRAPLAYTRSVLDWRVGSTNATWLSRRLGTGSTEALVYSLAGRVRIDADSVVIENLSGNIGHTRFLESARLDSGRVRLARGERIDAAFAGDLSGRRFELTGRLGRLIDILAGDEPWPLDVNARLGDSYLALATQLDRDPNGVALRGLSLEIAGSRVTGEVELDQAAATSRIVADLDARALDLSPWLTARPASSGGAAVSILDRELPLGWLDSVEAAIEVAVGEIRGLPITLRNARLVTRLADGALALMLNEAEIAGLGVTGDARLAAAGRAARFDVHLSTPRVELERVLEDIAPDRDMPVGAAADSVSVALEASGTTIRSALVASAATVTLGPVEIRPAAEATWPSVTLSSVRLGVEPGAPVLAEAQGTIALPPNGGTEFVLRATGGTLAELLSARRLWPVVDLGIDTRWRDTPVRASGRIADTAALLNLEPTEIRAQASWGAFRVALDGLVGPSATMAGTNVRIDVGADDLAAAGRQLGAGNWPGGKATLAGRATIADRQWNVADLAIAAPGIAGGGVISVNRVEHPTANGRIDFASLDFTPYASAARRSVSTAPAEGAEQGSDSVAFALHRFSSAEPFVLDRLRLADLDLEVHSDVLRFGAFVSNDVGIDLSAQSGVLALDASLDAGRLRATARVDARTDEIDLAVNLSAAGVALAADRSGIPAPGTPVLEYEAQLAGRGGSLDALVGSLTGDLLLYLRGGRIQSGGLRFLFGSVLYQLLDVINPFSARSPYVDIDCAGAYFTVAGGVVSTDKGIVMQTPEVQIVGLGSLNLASGDLTMQFRTKPRTGVVSLGGIVNEFVELAGTIDAPRVAISAERAARTGLLAVVTGGLSLLATDVFKRMTAGNVCTELPSFVGAPGAAQPR